MGCEYDFGSAKFSFFNENILAQLIRSKLHTVLSINAAKNVGISCNSSGLLIKWLELVTKIMFTLSRARINHSQFHFTKNKIITNP